MLESNSRPNGTAVVLRHKLSKSLSAEAGECGTSNAATCPRYKLSAWKTAVLFAIIMTVALVFRFTALDRIPPGVSSDEALNGNEGIHAQKTGDYRIFYSTNNGREGLWINLVGVSESIFGVNQFGLRFWSAVVGSLTVVFVYLLAAELFSVRTALFGAWLLATSFWHVAFSRIAFRAILVPLLFTSSIFFLLRAFRAAIAGRPTTSLFLASFGGLVYGLGFHSYIAYRFTLFVVIVLAGLDLRRHLKLKQPLRPWLLLLALWLGMAVITALPIGLYFLRHPGDFVARAKQVSVFNEPDPAGAFWSGLLHTLAQFNIRGDCSWLSNIGCSPLLILPVGFLFAIGVALAVRTAIREGVLALPHWLLFIWFLVMLLPAVMAGGPSGIRSIGTVPPVFILAGVAADWIFSKLQATRVACGLFLLALVATAAVEGTRYFYVWPRDPHVPYEFDASKIDIGRFLNTLGPATPRYVAVDRDDDDVRIPYKNSDGSEFPLPIAAETILFETQGRRSPTFLFEDEATNTSFPPGSVIVQLYSSPRFFAYLQSRGLSLRTGVAGGIQYAVVY
jgi:hypothetical protein